MNRRGLTLIELLVVVAVLGILAAIAVPNFQEAMVRSKVSRSDADMRTLATALESYAVDYSTYPPDGNGDPYRGLVAMTTPVAYQTTIPHDPFNMGYLDGYTDDTSPDEDLNEARYYELGTGSFLNPGRGFPAQVWGLAGYGPDRDDDTRTIGAFPFTARAIPYDPTNGTASSGDLYRLGPKGQHPNFLADVNPVSFSD